MRIPRAGIPLLFITLLQSGGNLQSQVDPRVEGMERTGPMITWTGIGAGGGGAMSEVAVDPSDPEILYVGSDVGGPFKSTDGGETWSAIVEGTLGLGRYYQTPTTGLVIHPYRSEILYKGGRYLFKSTDGGDRWEIVRDQPSTRVAIDPWRPDTVYVTDRFGKTHIPWIDFFQVSVNGGSTWTTVSDSGLPDAVNPLSIAVDPLTAEVFLGTNKGVFSLNVDGPDTFWVDRNDGLPVDWMESLYQDTWYAISPLALVRPDSSTRVMYVAADTVFRSTDGGSTWERCNSGDLPLSTNDRLQFQNVMVHPSNPDIAYITGRGAIFKTTDGGGSWLEVLNRSDGGWLDWWMDVRCMTMCAGDPDVLLAGSAVAVMKSTDAGASWNPIYTHEAPPGSGYWTTRGFDNVYSHACAVDPQDPERLYAGFADIGFLESTDGGRSFAQRRENMHLDSVGEDIYAIAVDPVDPATVYASVYHYLDSDPSSKRGSVVKSTDFGVSWDSVWVAPEPLMHVSAIALGRQGGPDERRVYISLFNTDDDLNAASGVYRSTDGGDSWEMKSSGLGTTPAVGTNRKITALVIDPLDDDHVYASIATRYTDTRDSLALPYGGIWETRDGGETWTQANTGTVIPCVYDLAVDPGDINTLYAGAGDHVDWYRLENLMTPYYYPGGVYKSTDGGITWDRRYEDVWIEEIAVNPAYPDVIYAAAKDFWPAAWQEQNHTIYPDPDGIYALLNCGILRSGDAGETWTMENHGLDHLSFDLLYVNPVTPDILYTGTLGGGLFRGIDGYLRRKYLDRPGK